MRLSNSQILERIRNHSITPDGQYGSLLEATAKKWSRFPLAALPGSGGASAGTRRIDLLEGIEDPNRRNLCAMMMENCYNGMRSQLNEATLTNQVGNYDKYLFPTIRMVFANLVADRIVSVQPLPGPSGMIFYYEGVSGSTKGRIKKGDKLYDPKRGPERSFNLTSETVEKEYRHTANGVLNSFNGTLDYIPIRSGTVEITDGTQRLVDQGDGTLAGDGTGTINYATGAYTITFAAPPEASIQIDATYEYDSEASDLVPRMDIQLRSVPVITRPRKFKASWSMEGEQDLMAMHGMRAEAEFVALMSNRIAQETNEGIIKHLRTVAFNNDNPIVFDNTPAIGVPYIQHREVLIQVFTTCASLVFNATQRVNPNWIIISTEVANIVRNLMPYFTPIPEPEGVTGIRQIGRLGQFDVYQDPAYPQNEWLMGFKGESFLDTGYVHAVYQGLVATPTIMLDDFVSRKGMMSRTAQKVVNEFFYVRGNLINSEPTTPPIATP